jgi:4-hydroxybenzoate polyprenyltransferase
MKAIKIALKLDTFIQGVVILATIVALVALAFNKEYSGYAWKAFFTLGGVQILSAIGMGLALYDSKRGEHIAYSLGYFLGFVLLLPILSGFAAITNLNTTTIVLGGMYMFGIPAFLAIKYFNMTVRDMIRVNTVRRSFWDL